MPLLSPAGPPGRLPVRLHSPKLSLVRGPDRPVRTLRTGSRPRPRAGRFVNEGKQLLYFAWSEHGFENRKVWGLNRFGFFVEEHCCCNKKNKEEIEPGVFQKMNRREERRGKGKNVSVGDGYLRCEKSCKTQHVGPTTTKEIGKLYAHLSKEKKK